ncbi:hypothetical protein IWW48_003151 [Coemansia sp. RSA 1200]|nr:hypothetical protein IWW48_003151 [Coemansia sp. RSA 1200]
MAAKSEGSAFETLFAPLVNNMRSLQPIVTRRDSSCVRASGTGEREVADIDTEIKRLNEDLEVSRNNKRHKIAYDEIAIEANKLPTRERLSADISTITSEIEQLRQEEVTHNAILESLRVQYSAVVDEMKRLESMSKSALSMQDLGIYLGDMEEEDRGSGEPGGHSFLGISPTTPHPPGDPHGDFGTPIDNSVLDDDGNDHNGSEDSPNKHAKKNEEEAEAEAEDGDYTNDDIEDGEDSGHHHATHMVDILGAESNADAIDSEEEGECEDEEGELIV